MAIHRKVISVSIDGGRADRLATMAEHGPSGWQSWFVDQAIREKLARHDRVEARRRPIARAVDRAPSKAGA